MPELHDPAHPGRATRSSRRQRSSPRACSSPSTRVRRVIQEALGTVRRDGDRPGGHRLRRPPTACPCRERRRRGVRAPQPPVGALDTIVVNSVTRDDLVQPAELPVPERLHQLRGEHLGDGGERPRARRRRRARPRGSSACSSPRRPTPMHDGSLAHYPGLQSDHRTSRPALGQRGQPAGDDGRLVGRLRHARTPQRARRQLHGLRAGCPAGYHDPVPDHAGFDQYFGYGRIDAARILQWVSQGDIPPQAEIDSPSWFGVDNPDQTLNVTGTIGTTRSPTCRYQVDVGVGPDPVRELARSRPRHRPRRAQRRARHEVPLASVRRSSRADRLRERRPVSGNGRPGSRQVHVHSSRRRPGRQGPRRAVGIGRRRSSSTATRACVRDAEAVPNSVDAPHDSRPHRPRGHQRADRDHQAGGTIHASLPRNSELPGWPVHTNADSLTTPVRTRSPREGGADTPAGRDHRWRRCR